jgi:hypothetical protein
LVLGSNQPAASDGIAKSAASGAAGGVVQVSSVTTNLTATPKVSTTVHAGAKLTAIRNIDVQAKAMGDVSAIAEGDGGGVVAVGVSNSTVTLKPESVLTIHATAVLKATGNEAGTTTGSITVLSTTSADAYAKGRGVSGGLVAVADATVTTTVSHVSTLEIGDSAQLTTNGILLVESRSDTEADAISNLTAGGGVAVATNTTTLNLGSAGTPATTTTAIGTNALLQGATVTIGARVTKLDLNVDADEEADGLGSGATAEALMTIHDKTEVSLAAGASVTGDTVTIHSNHENISLVSTATATAYAVIGIPNAEAKVDYNSTARIVAAAGAMVSGRVVNVNTTQQIDKLERNSTEYAWHTGGSSGGETSGAYNATREISWNGNVVLLSGPDPELVVDGSGVIVKAIGVTVGGLGQGQTVAAGPVSVDSIINNTAFSTGTITNTTGAGTSPIVVSTSSTAGLTDGRVVTITGASNPNANGTFVIANVIANTSFTLVGTTGAGSAGSGGTWLTGGAVTFTADTVTGTGGKISAATAYRSVDIRNSLNRDLVINGINVVTPSATPTIFINATNWQTFAFTVGSDVSPTEITIDSQGATSDIRLNAPSVLPGTDQGFAIYNPLGTTKIIAAQGSILNAGGTPQLPTIWTRALDLQAAGSVGTSSSRLNVDLVRTSGQTGLDIEAGADVFLDLRGRLRATGVTEPVFQGGTIQTAGQIDLLLESAVQDVPASGTSGTISVQRYVNGVLMAFASDVLTLPTYTTSTIGGTYRFELLDAGDASGNIRINAVNAANTSANQRVSFASGTDMGASGELLAVTNGDITLSERSGDFRIRNVSSSAGNVSLAATGDSGSIFDLATEGTAYGTTPWVIGNSVSLSSRDGGIGWPGDFLEINSSNQAAGAVIALAKNGVYLTETVGDLNIDQVLSRISDVVLIAQSGSMLEAGDDAQADIQGRNIDLIATSAGSRIGDAGNPLELLGGGTGQRPNDGFQIEQYAPGTGRLVAQANAGVYLTQTSGAMNVLDVQTPTGNVALAVHDSVLAGEDLNLLQSGGQTFLGAILGTPPLAHGRILAPTGSVTASAGDDFTLPTGTLIQGGSAAGNKVVIRGGQWSDAPKDPDPVGSILTIAGTVAANAVEIFGGSNLDYFDLINPAGINAPTTLTGNAGDDRFFIQAVSAAMTIHGGAGANRYYISSNAARSLFVTDGVFDDRGDDLAFPFSASRLSSGTLATITAALTINTGDGGNGGARDAIYLSAAGSTTALTAGLVTASQVTGLGNSGSINYTTTTNGGTSLLLKLGALDDQLQVTGAGVNTQILVFGGDGDDTVNVGNAGDPLSAVSGIVAFFGEGGSGDTLNVHGVATPPATGEVNPNQLTAIAVTGLGSQTNKLIATHNDLFGAGYTIKNITLSSSGLEAAQLTLANIQALSSQLQNPTRNIDTYVANRLSVATSNALFDYRTGAEVVYRVNTPGTTPIVGLTDDTVYFVSGADSPSVFLVVSLDDLSHAIAVPRSSIGETNQVTLAHLDSGNRVVIHVSPTSTFAGNETVTDNKIVFAGNHNLTTGQAVVYHIDSGNAPIGGLTDGGVYYVINVDDTSIQLASSLANAQSDPPVPVTLSSPSDGTPDTLAPLASVSFDPSSVNANQIVFSGNHDLVDLQKVVYRAGDGNSPISPLAEGQSVWVIYIDATTIQLASSLPNAHRSVRRPRVGDGLAGVGGQVVAPGLTIRLALEDVDVVCGRADGQPAVDGIEIHVDAEARCLSGNPAGEGGRGTPVKSFVHISVNTVRNFIRDEQRARHGIVDRHRTGVRQR